MEVPEGRLKREVFWHASRFSRPSGTEKGGAFPTVKTVGYYQLSLRDFRNRNELGDS